MKELYCGLDIGTSSAKAMVCDQSLRGVFGASRDYDFAVTSRDRAELDPEEVFSAVVACVRACVQQANAEGAQLRFIALSSALHSFIVIDAAGRPLTNCITWADMRATQFNEELNSYCNGRIYRKTGCPGNAIYMPAKILWIRKYRPDVYDAASKYISIKEYVLFRLTDEWIVDYGIASGGGLLNLENLEWDLDVLQMLGITAKELSVLVDGPTVVSMTRRASKEIGADVPIVVGSGDGQLANLGTGTYGSGQFVATIGSSGAVRVFTHQPVLDSEHRTWCYRLDGRTCLAGGAINNGGLVLKWLIDNCFQKEADRARREKASIYHIMNETVRDVPAGSNGLLFLPFLTGERSPDWNSKARGLIIGLGMSHSRKDLIKAAMEGVVMRLHANFIVLQELVGTAETIVVNGGFTHSRVWLQIMADIFGKTLLLYENSDNSALGAVLMGFKALNIIDTYDRANLKLKLKETIAPNYDNASCYRDLCRLNEDVYARNKDLFEQLYTFRGNHAGKDSDHA